MNKYLVDVSFVYINNRSLYDMFTTGYWAFWQGFWEEEGLKGKKVGRRRLRKGKVLLNVVHALVSVARACPTASTDSSSHPATTARRMWSASSLKKVRCCDSLVIKCKGPDQITKCRKNLYRICTFLETYPVNTPLDGLDAIQIQATALLQKV